MIPSEKHPEEVVLCLIVKTVKIKLTQTEKAD